MNKPSLPESLLQEYGVTSPEQIDVEAIAYDLGAIVKYRNLKNCAARIVGSGHKAIISVDASSSIGRRRFSIGHELGHLVKDHGKGFLCTNKDMNSAWSLNNPETLANQFSADLLMPRFLFKPLAKGREITFRTVNELSDTFRVSKTATAIRLVENGSMPGLVICHEKKTRRYKWFKRGPDVPYEIWPCDELSHETAAFSLLYGDEEQRKPQLSDASDWIKHKNSFRYAVIEDSIKISEDMIISLIWWKNESQLSDLLEY